MRRLPAAAAALLLLTVAACDPGDGSTLDERGYALAHPSAPGLGSTYGLITFDPTYRSVARDFFGQLCVGCHAGASAPKGLDLTEDEAWEHLVEVPSVQRPDLHLVAPGAPDSSYLIVKLTGGDGMAGRQMPRNQPARAAEEIDVIRAWIAEGAVDG